MIMTIKEFEKEYKKNEFIIDESYNIISLDEINLKITIKIGKIEIVKSKYFRYKFNSEFFELGKFKYFYKKDTNEIKFYFSQIEDYEMNLSSNIENFYSYIDDCLFNKLNSKIVKEIEENSFLTLNIEKIREIHNNHINQIKTEIKKEIKTENLKKFNETFIDIISLN